MEQVVGGEQLLDTARDFFNFVTNFFEVINTSATHIHHSALELSPLSSILRKLHYHRRFVLMPRLVTGTPDSWDESVMIFSKDPSHGYESHAWSQCGRFVATQKQDAVEIRDPLTLELLSALKPAKPTALTGPLAYSPDGHSLACLSNTAIIIWDIQTHQMVKDIECDNSGLGSLVWSLDGRTIGTLLKDWKTYAWVARIHDVTSGTTLPPITFWPTDIPHLWVHDKSFRIAMTVRGSEVCHIDIVDFGVGRSLTKVESFRIPLWKEYPRIKSFSPTTHCVSISADNQLAILDVRNSKILLQAMVSSEFHCFSTDGSHFAASPQMTNIHVWKYSSGCYTLLKKVSCRETRHFSFSPTSLSILGHFGRLLRVWRLDAPPVAPSPAVPSERLTGLSYNGTYMATAVRRSEGTVTITNFLSQHPSQFIDTGVAISGLALTGNVLLVIGSGKVMAWLLTEEGVVEGILNNRRADAGDSVWALSVEPRGFKPKFSAKHQIGAIISRGGRTLRTYHTGTGRDLKSHPLPWDGECQVDTLQGSHHLRVHEEDPPPGNNWLVSRAVLQEGWVKGPEGRHRLWLPVEWRISLDNERWCHDITTLHFKIPGNELVIIKF